MKQNDIVLIIVCVFISGVLSVVLSNAFFGSSKRQVEVEVVEKISSEFVQPNTSYFNSNSINPTQQIQIGTGTSNVLFGQ